MQKWIAGSACAATVLSLAIASAETYPSRTGAKRAANTTQRITVTGCVMQGMLTHRRDGWCDSRGDGRHVGYELGEPIELVSAERDHEPE